jgi:release factor glutamine methyltransferase
MSTGRTDIDVARALSSGVTAFMGLELAVRPGALVARPETELLGQQALRLLRDLGGRRRVIDICCGSGNLACAIAFHLPESDVWAADLTEPCVALTRHNATRLKLGIQVFQGDLFTAFGSENLVDTVDMIVCNPPYISTGKLAKEKAALLESEPREAFDGGPYGLTIHARVIKEGLPLLKAHGYLLCEFGLGQEKQMKQLFERSRAYHSLTFVADDAGAPRVVVAQKN